MNLIEGVIGFLLSKMLLFLRTLFHVGRRASHRVSPFTVSSSHGSLTVCPWIWFTTFLCIIRYPFASKSNPSYFFDDINKELVRTIIQQEQWDGNNRILSLFDSALAPIWVSKVLVELKGDPKLACRFFKWAGTRIGFRHTTESYCVLIHILFYKRMYSDAHEIMRELVLLRWVLPGCDVFDVLWSTRNVCVPGFGVFDALFSVLVEVGMLEEASECFLRMKNYRVLPKTRSCNALLHGLSKSGKGELSRKFFKEMIGAGIKPSVFTYNIMIDYMCKEGDLGAARSLFQQMKQMGLVPDSVTYNSLIDGHGKVGLLDESVCIFEEMKDVGCEPDAGVIPNQKTYTALFHGYIKAQKMESAMHILKEMKEKSIKPDILLYGTIIWCLCCQNKLEECELVIGEMKGFGLSTNHFICTTLMDAYFKAGKTTEALNLLQEMQDLSIEINVQQARKFLDEMIGKGIIPDEILCICLLRKYYELGNMDEAIDLQNEMVNRGLLTRSGDLE
ncbi:putative pentatricopeptide repeat-containing protein, partial [Quercus suber]